MAPTGDLKNNLEKIMREVRKMKLEVKVNPDGCYKGLPSSYLAILHAAVLHYSLALAKYLISKGYVIYAKSDIQFIHEVYEMMRNEFHYHPKLTEAHFLSEHLYAERKMELTECFLKFCQEKYTSITQKKKVASTSRIMSEACLCILPCDGPKKVRRKTLGRGSDVHPPEVFSFEVHGIRNVWSEHVSVTTECSKCFLKTPRRFPAKGNTPLCLAMHATPPSPHPLPSYSSPDVKSCRYSYPSYRHVLNDCPATTSHHSPSKQSTTFTTSTSTSYCSPKELSPPKHITINISDTLDYSSTDSSLGNVSTMQPPEHVTRNIVSVSDTLDWSSTDPSSLGNISTMRPPKHVIKNIVSDQSSIMPPPKHVIKNIISDQMPPPKHVLKNIVSSSDQSSTIRPPKHVIKNIVSSSSDQSSTIRPPKHVIKNIVSDQSSIYSPSLSSDHQASRQQSMIFHHPEPLNSSLCMCDLEH